jgi:DNA topoisomerase-6 subunit B
MLTYNDDTSYHLINNYTPIIPQALIWSKKSSGLPIKIRTAHCSTANGAPSAITEMVLDIDIQRNEPNVISNVREANPEGWRGVSFQITIGGNWSSYRSRVLQYFQQLAVITPYAHFSLEFEAAKDVKKNFTAEFVHRSDQMPPIAGVVLPHPKSVNNITLSSLIALSTSPTLNHFLGHDLSSLSPKLIKDILDNLNLKDADLDGLTSSHIAALCQVLRDDTSIKPPLANCLSPAGEYNMRLGVLKELKPKLVSTYTDKPGSHEGHAFLVEAAISLGGESVKEGINIFRFANRIPMLFETGADVVTQVATKRIKWSTYLIDPKKDSVGVYVSIVSTRIPFKGTSKEYIGDDVLEIQHSVKRALIGCCQQMKGQLAESMAKKNVFEKQKALLKYELTSYTALYYTELPVTALTSPVLSCLF